MVAGIAAINITLDHNVEERPDLARLSLKSLLILEEKPVNSIESRDRGRSTPKGMDDKIWTQQERRFKKRAGPGPKDKHPENTKVR